MFVGLGGADWWVNEAGCYGGWKCRLEERGAGGRKSWSVPVFEQSFVQIPLGFLPAENCISKRRFRSNDSGTIRGPRSHALCVSEDEGTPQCYTAFKVRDVTRRLRGTQAGIWTDILFESVGINGVIL